MSENLISYSADQVLSQVLDRTTDPNGPALRILASFEAGDINLGNVDVVSQPGDTLSSSGAQSPVTSIGTASAVVITANAARYELILCNTGTVNYWLNTDAAAVAASGLPLPVGSERRITGGLAKREWQAIGDAASGGVIRPFIGVI